MGNPLWDDDYDTPLSYKLPTTNPAATSSPRTRSRRSSTSSPISPSSSRSFRIPCLPSRLSGRRALAGVVLVCVFYVCAITYPRSTFGRILSLGQDVCIDDLGDLPQGLQEGQPFRFSKRSNYDNFYVPFLKQTRKHSETTGGKVVPAECLLDHLSSGTECSYPEEPKLDVVWTYVNGSDKLHEEAFKTNMAAFKRAHSELAWLGPKPGAFREFDELRYSVRSVLSNFRSSARKMFIVASDFPWPGCEITSPWRLGQLPQWLLPEDGRKDETWEDGDTSMHVVHHSTIFGDLHNQSTFNSLAIESRLGYVPGVSDYFVYMNDDVFFNRPMNTRDFYSKDLGPVFRMQPDLLVGGRKPQRGEWVALAAANTLLDMRFGNRSRPYVAHFAKTFSIPFMQEINAVWHEELRTTASHPFRSLNYKFEVDVSPTLMMTHWVVERWREMLLWSYFVGSVGGADDEWGDEQERRLWEDMAGNPMADKIDIQREVRDTLKLVKEKLQHEWGKTGVKDQTDYVYSSYDGYPYSGLDKIGFRQWPSFQLPPGGRTTLNRHMAHKCTIEVNRCFILPPGVPSTASEMFKHVSFRKVDCGDCILNGLMKNSGTLGLEAFLPPKERQLPSRPMFGAKNPVPRLPLHKNWWDIDYTLKSIKDSDLTVREWVSQALIRYRFVIGGTPATFVQLETMTQATRHLRVIDGYRGTHRDPAMICINDDVSSMPHLVRAKLIDWFDNRWPSAAKWESS